MKLTKQITEVFTKDDYGGVKVIELDWEQDVTWEDGELNDGFDSIKEYFTYSSKHRNGKWYANLQDCVDQINPFTEIEEEKAVTSDPLGIKWRNKARQRD